MHDGLERCIVCGGWDLSVDFLHIEKDADKVIAPVHCNGCQVDYHAVYQRTYNTQEVST
jgi:hypothetical protein